MKTCSCHFHLCRNVYRKIQQLGLTNHYRNNEFKIGKFLSSYIWFTVLGATHIKGSFVFNLSRTNSQMIPSDDKVEQKCSYLFGNNMLLIQLFFQNYGLLIINEIINVNCFIRNFVQKTVIFVIVIRICIKL